MTQPTAPGPPGPGARALALILWWIIALAALDFLDDPPARWGAIEARIQALAAARDGG